MAQSDGTAPFWAESYGNHRQNQRIQPRAIKPSKNVYNNGIQQFRLVQDARAVEACRINPITAPNYKESHNMGMNALGQITFPSKAYTIQRNWLQLHVCKPLKMTVRNFQFRIKEINSMLVQFPATWARRPFVSTK